MTSALVAGMLLLALCAHLLHLARRSRARAADESAADLASLSKVLDGVRGAASGTAGVSTFVGTWRGHQVQVRTIVDTLATRKLPALWLSVTLIGDTSMPAVFDMMMRPGSATTFSNFDFLPHGVPAPASYPEGAVIRTDSAGVSLPLHVIARHLDGFGDPNAKELLVTRNGVRLVWLLAEADRARYGVFRQAAFTRGAIDPQLVASLLARASALRAAINRAALELAA